MLFKYIDSLPHPPKMDPQSAEPVHNDWHNPLYKIFYCEDPIYTWCQEVFAEYDPYVNTFMYHYLEDGVPRHVDTDRDYCYNYIIDTGGKAVRTRWWQDDECIEDTVLQAGRWHRLDTSVAHSIEGITGKRVAVTVFRGIPRS